MLLLCFTETQCNQVNNCDPNADCRYDVRTERYRCECRSGYEGDGVTCTVVADCSRNRDICDVNARCERSGLDFVCVCNPGYQGDGTRCFGKFSDALFGVKCVLNWSTSYAHNQSYSHVVYLVYLHVDLLILAATAPDNEEFLVVAQGQSLLRVPLDPAAQGRLIVHKPGHIMVGVDMDCRDQRVYWTDVKGSSISRARLDGSDTQVLLRGERFA